MCRGIETREVYDSATRSLKTGRVEKSTPVYVLIYSRCKYKRMEPISHMSNMMAKVLTNDNTQLILQNQLLSHMFGTLVSKLTVLKERSNFVFNFLFNVRDCEEFIKKAIIKRAKDERSVAEFVINDNREFIINKLTVGQESTRQDAILLFNTTIQTLGKDAKDCIDFIRSMFDHFLEKWRTIDDAVEPVLFYVKNVAS